MRRFILIPHLKIHNANAMSSPFTIGFPRNDGVVGSGTCATTSTTKFGF